MGGAPKLVEGFEEIDPKALAIAIVKMVLVE